VTSNVDTVSAHLAAKRSEVEAELASLATTAQEAGAGIGFGKRVGDGTTAAVERFASVAVHDRLTELLADVVRAQVKLSQGTYGTCDECGRPIPPERLDALPWATLCVEDADRRDD
jgi:RNA polymerase-binding transcription factor